MDKLIRIAEDLYQAIGEGLLLVPLVLFAGFAIYGVILIVIDAIKAISYLLG